MFFKDKFRSSGITTNHCNRNRNIGILQRNNYKDMCNVKDKIKDIFGTLQDEQIDSCTHFQQHSKNTTRTSMIDVTLDPRSATNLLENSVDHLCAKLVLSSDNNFKFTSESSDNAYLGELKCNYNRTISFHLLDSSLSHDIAENIYPGVLNNEQKTATFIIDNETESTYKMDDSLTVTKLTEFINNFVNKNLTRTLRWAKPTEIRSTGGKLTSIKEINSKNFKAMIEMSNSTSVVLFYSLQCALCNIMSQILLSISHRLRGLNIDFFRTDGDKNDFVWEYTMDSFPTLLISPVHKKEESRLFPQHLEVNEKNILGFVLANLSPMDRLKALMQYCISFKSNIVNLDCVRTLRKEILENISRNLTLWQFNISSRTAILQKLKILHDAYISLFEVKNPNVIINLQTLFQNTI